MDNKNSQLEQVILPKDLQVKLSELPQIISNKTKLITELEMKVNEARIKAESAEKQAQEIKGYTTKKHIEAINKYGLIEGYRKTYGPVKEVIERNKVCK